MMFPSLWAAHASTLIVVLFFAPAYAQFQAQPGGTKVFPIEQRAVFVCKVDVGYIIDWDVTFPDSMSPIQAGRTTFRPTFAQRNVNYSGVATNSSTLSFGILDASENPINNGTIVVCIAQQNDQRIRGNEVQVYFINDLLTTIPSITDETNTRAASTDQMVTTQNVTLDQKITTQDVTPSEVVSVILSVIIAVLLIAVVFFVIILFALWYCGLCKIKCCFRYAKTETVQLKPSGESDTQSNCPPEVVVRNGEGVTPVIENDVERYTQLPDAHADIWKKYAQFIECACDIVMKINDPGRVRLHLGLPENLLSNKDIVNYLKSKHHSLFDYKSFMTIKEDFAKHESDQRLDYPDYLITYLNNLMTKDDSGNYILEIDEGMTDMDMNDPALKRSIADILIWEESSIQVIKKTLKLDPKLPGMNSF